jgi:hypothetical protein
MRSSRKSANQGAVLRPTQDKASEEAVRNNVYPLFDAPAAKEATPRKANNRETEYVLVVFAYRSSYTIRFVTCPPLYSALNAGRQDAERQCIG